MCAITAESVWLSGSSAKAATKLFTHSHTSAHIDRQIHSHIGTDAASQFVYVAHSFTASETLNAGATAAEMQFRM